MKRYHISSLAGKSIKFRPGPGNKIDIPKNVVHLTLSGFLPDNGVKSKEGLRKGGREMPTFVVLAKWTEKSFASIKDAPAMAEEVKKTVTAMGAKIKGWYLLMGQYDEMCILEAPNAETVAKILIPLSVKYGGKTETMQAFSEEEAMALIAGMK
jgi:uncharacterized protein with GYD domain